MKSLMIKIFICLEAALYLAFTAMDIYAPGDSKWLKFAGIALCFVFSAFLSVKGGEKLVTAAIGLAMAADVFLLLLDKYYIAGVRTVFHRSDYCIFCAYTAPTGAKARGWCGFSCLQAQLRCF